MGRRWWQKEARAKAEQEKRAQKNAASTEEVQEVTDAAFVGSEEATTFEADVIVNEATVELIQTISEIKSDEVVEHEPVTVTEAESESAVEEDVSVPGITITTNNFNTSNKKKRRR